MKFEELGGQRRVWAIDLDGTLTNGEPFWEQTPTPRADMVARVVELYQTGNIVIIWTARQWRHAPETVGWLVANGVPFHGLQMGKGGADYYVDDKVYDLGTLIELGPPARKTRVSEPGSNGVAATEVWRPPPADQSEAEQSGV